MKSNFLGILLAIACVCNAQHEDLKTRYKQVKVATEGMLAVMNASYKWGYVDERTLVEVVPTVYDKVYGFAEGYSCVSLNDKFGFIDKTGKEIQ